MTSFILTAVALLAVPVQTVDLGETLKKGKWRAVWELSQKPDSRGELESLLKSPDEDKRWWAGATIAEMDARKSAGPAYPEPTLVTLKAKDRPTIDVIREIVSDVGFELAEGSAAAGHVTLQFDRTPFLEALLEVCRREKLQALPVSKDRMNLKRDHRVQGRWRTSGLFAHSLASVTRTTDVSFVEPPRKSLTLVFLVRMDPRLNIVQGDNRLTLVTARDNTGRPLTSKYEHAILHMGWPRSPRTQAYSMLQVELEAPGPDVVSVALIRATAKATFSGASEEIVFGDVMSGEDQTRKVDGITVTLNKCIETQRGYDVELEISSERPFGTWSMPQSRELRLLDGRGQVVTDRLDRGSRSGGIYKLSYRVRGRKDRPEELRVPLVTRTYERTVYLELRDIPLK